MENKMREAKKALDKLINGAIRNGYPSDTALELGKIVSSSISQVEQEPEPESDPFCWTWAGCLYTQDKDRADQMVRRGFNVEALYKASPQPATIPDEMTKERASDFIHEPSEAAAVVFECGWNECRKAMLSTAPSTKEEECSPISDGVEKVSDEVAFFFEVITSGKTGLTHLVALPDEIPVSDGIYHVHIHERPQPPKGEE